MIHFLVSERRSSETHLSATKVLSRQVFLVVSKQTSNACNFAPYTVKPGHDEHFLWSRQNDCNGYNEQFCQVP